MKNNYLSFSDRKRIEALYNLDESIRDIAEIMCVHITTIYRELWRGRTSEMNANGRMGYSADIAQKAFCENLKRRGRKNTLSQKGAST